MVMHPHHGGNRGNWKSSALTVGKSLVGKHGVVGMFMSGRRAGPSIPAEPDGVLSAAANLARGNLIAM
jgi:hypothetical protein